MKMRLELLAALLTATTATLAGATPLVVTSYDTINGDGQAHSGSFNYWDRNYTGSGSTTTDRSLLTGGLGDLTDGYIETQNWNLVENVAGTGPYVGWRAGFGPYSPEVTFYFGGLQTFTSATFYFDVSNLGGVGQPASIQVGSLNFILPIFGGSAPASFTADLSSLAADDSLLVIFERSSEWIFVSEVQFDGSAAAAVPEPGTCGLVLVGLVVVGGMARRKRSTRLSTKAP